MSSCCNTAGTDAQPCPMCGDVGPVVGFTPVRPHFAEAAEGDWQYCPNEVCEVIYYLGADTVEVGSVVTQVGLKATDKATPVCFCFAHTTDALGEDLTANKGGSQIKAEIKAAVADGLCACEHLNPSGRCCLADVHRTLKLLAQPTPA